MVSQWISIRCHRSRYRSGLILWGMKPSANRAVLLRTPSAVPPTHMGGWGVGCRASAENVAVQVKELAGEGDGVAGPEGLHHFEGLVAVAATLADGRVVGLERAGDIASGPDPQDEATRGEAVEGGDCVGQADGVSQRQQDDGGAE